MLADQTAGQSDNRKVEQWVDWMGDKKGYVTVDL